MSTPAVTAAEISEVKQKTVSGVVSFFFRTALIQGIGLVSALLLSAFLSPEDFGVYGFVTQLIGLLIFFSDVGLAASLVQRHEEPTVADYRTAFWTQQLLSWLIVSLCLGLLLIPAITLKIGSAGMWVLVSLALSFPLASLKTIPSIILERKLDFNRLVIPQIFEQIIFNGVLIALAWNGYGVISYAYAIIIRSIAGVVVMYTIQGWSFGFNFDMKALKALLSFGLKFQLNDFLARIKDQLFFLALGAYLPIRDFGYMQWAKNWSMYPYNLTVQNIMSVTFPTFARLQHDVLLLKKAIEKSIFFISLSIFPILVAMSVFIGPLTEVVEKYHKWQPSVPSFILFALSIGWSAISTPLVNTLNAIGKINESLKLMVLWTVLTWILTPPLVWWFGFTGVALSAFIISFTSIMPVMIVRKIVPIVLWPQVKTALIASLVMALVGIIGQPIWRQGLTELLLGGVGLSAVYAATAFAVGGKQIIAEVKSLKTSKAKTESIPAAS
jgi:O-antigen/teichoic acid export membrane protein